MGVFEDRSLEPMLFFESEVFDSKDYIYELKFDGARCLAYLDSKQTVLINKRQKDISSIYPELMNMHTYAKNRCVIDGELVAMENGKPNFYLLQKRSLSSNPFKIKQMMAKIPITFVAFDILYLNDRLLTDLPLLERKSLLKENIIESNQLIVSRYIETRGNDFYQLAKAQDLEGIVAKKKDSLYFMGKRSRVWLKMKVYQEEDLIIGGYVPNEYGMKDIIFGRFNETGKIVYAASVMSAKQKQIIMDYAKKYPSPPLFPTSQEDVVWMKPYLVGTVQYMMKTQHGGLRQAVFKGIRDDKTVEDLIK